jgi:hypothetical protein
LLAFGLSVTALGLYGVFFGLSGQAMGLVIAGIGAWVSLAAWRKVNTSVVLHRGGLVYRAARLERTVAWQDVARFTAGRVRHSVDYVRVETEHWIELEIDRGDPLRITHSLKGVDKVVDAVQEGTFRVLLARAGEALAMGQAVVFGSLAVEPSRIVADGRAISLRDARSVEVDRGWLTIYRDESGNLAKWVSVPVSTVANIAVFMALFRAGTADK